MNENTDNIPDDDHFYSDPSAQKPDVDFEKYFDNSKTNKDIANRLIYFRKEVIRMSQGKAAAAAGINQSDFGFVETGKRGLTYRMTNALVDKFDLNVSWLVTGKGLPQIGKVIPTLNAKTINIHTELADHKRRIEFLELRYSNLMSRFEELLKEKNP